MLANYKFIGKVKLIFYNPINFKTQIGDLEKS